MLLVKQRILKKKGISLPSEILNENGCPSLYNLFTYFFVDIPFKSNEMPVKTNCMIAKLRTVLVSGEFDSALCWSLVSGEFDSALCWSAESLTLHCLEFSKKFQKHNILAPD